MGPGTRWGFRRTGQLGVTSHDHGGQRSGSVQSGQPLDPPGVAAAEGGDLAVAPRLGGGPFDHVNAVDAVIAVGLEGPVGIAAPAHVDPDRGVAALGEGVGPLGGPLAAASVGGAHDHRWRRAVGREHQVGGEVIRPASESER